MGFMDFLFGSEPTQTTVTQPPMRPPGFNWAESFFNDYLPQFMSQGFPTYPGQLDPGLSPSMQALIRQGQNYTMSPFPDIMGQGSAALGRYLNTPYQPYQYQEGPAQGSLERYMNPSLVNPRQLMSPGGGFDTSFGMGQNIDLSGGERLMPPGSPGVRNMFSGLNRSAPPSPPLFTNDWPDQSGGVGSSAPQNPDRFNRGGGSFPSGGVPFLPPPQQTRDDVARVGFGFDQMSPQPYQPIGVNPSFVQWDPSGGFPALGPGGGAAFQGAPTPRSPGGDPNAIVPQGQLEWFGNWRGPNRGMGREYAIADMWRRGWDMGEEYAPSQEILDRWAAAGEPMEFGSKPTYRREIDQRMGNQGRPGTTSPVLPGGGDGAVRNTAGGGDAAVRNIGGASSSFDPRQRNDSFNPFESSLRKAAPRSKPGVIDMVRRPESSAGSPSFFFPPQGEPLEPRFPSSAGGPPQTPTPTPMSPGTSALDVYRGFLPVADEAIRSGVSDAMATAGFTGNRFSTSAMNRAGEVGGRVAQNLGSELLNRLYDQTQADLDRGLSATGMGLQNEQFRNQLGFQGQENFQDRLLRATSLVPQLAGSEEAIRRGRLQTPFDIFRYEQDRQDRYPLLSMDDFNRSRLGYFPYLAQLAQSRGAGQSVPPITTQQGSSPGLVDFGQAALPWLIAAGVFASDRSLKRDIEDVDLARAYEVVGGLRPRKYRWKDTGKIDAGFVAQEVEEVADEYVYTDEDTEIKGISLPAIVSHQNRVIQDLVRRVNELEEDA